LVNDRLLISADVRCCSVKTTLPSPKEDALEVKTGIPAAKRVEAAARTIAGYLGWREWDAMAEDRADLRAKVRYGYDVNEPTRWDCREAATAVPALCINCTKPECG
jgi:hypothetical protein